MPRFRDEQGFDLVDWDKVSGRTVWAKEEFGKIIFRTDYPVDSVMKLNGEQRNIAQKAWTGDYHHIASIPLNVLHDSGMAEAATQQDDDFMSKWLNSSDNSAWRTKSGNV